MRIKINTWLRQSGPVPFVIYVILAAFLTYFSMYAFRRPFVAGTYEGLKLWGIEYKILAITAQVLGYTISKFLGIKIISELQADARIRTIILLILAGWFALLGFALVPKSWNVIFLFLNGFSMYLAFLAFHTFLFERWIALFRIKSNIGFLMYLADAAGYTGSVAVLFIKNFTRFQSSWLSLFINLAYITGAVTVVLGIGCVIYFSRKEIKEARRQTAEPLVIA